LIPGTKIDLPGPRNDRGIEDVIADPATSGQRRHRRSETDTNLRPAPGPSVAVSLLPRATGCRLEQPRPLAQLSQQQQALALPGRVRTGSRGSDRLTLVKAPAGRGLYAAAKDGATPLASD
jgi:hypothetical protein